mgnify:CR=1 FL=1
MRKVTKRMSKNSLKSVAKACIISHCEKMPYDINRGIVLYMLQDECSDIRQMEPSAVDGGRNMRILYPGVVSRLRGCPSLDERREYGQLPRCY